MRQIMALGAALLVMPAAARAQDRLVPTRATGASPSIEFVRFGGDGLGQFAFAGADSARVTSARQLSIPVTASVMVADKWSVDITALYANGSVSWRPLSSSGAGATRTATLAGISDVRARATGTIVDDRLFVTLGFNAPTGQTSLSLSEFSALRILAAPALGLGSTPVGAGASGTAGLIYARELGAWAVAAGASYEHRGTFQPVAALVAGAPTTNFLPGAVVRTSLSGDRLLGAHRIFLSVTADRFNADRLRGAVASGAGSSAESDLVVIRLGPVVSTDAQLQLASSTLDDVVLSTSYRWRAPFTRDGRSVSNSTGHYVEVGARGTLPVRSNTRLMLATDGRLHTGLGIDQGLPTSGVASVAATAALEIRRGVHRIQPFVRAQGGSLSQRNAIVGGGARSFAGFAAGLFMITRF